MLVRGKREQLVLHDGTTKRSTINLQVGASEVSFIRARRSFERRIRKGVESRVTPVPDRRAVEVVRPRLHVQYNDAAGAITVLSIDSVLLKSHFLHGIQSRRVRTFIA